jgi:H+/gluconate symporter-like permease
MLKTLFRGRRSAVSAMSPVALDRSSVVRGRGWILIGLAPVLLGAAAVVAVFSGLLTASPGQAFLTRALATAAALSFAEGYGLVMHGYVRHPERRIVIVLTRSAVSAVAAAALITGWQLLFVNDTVATGVRLTLLVLAIVGALGTVLAPLARRTGAAKAAAEPPSARRTRR